jgi:hypothetical protein
LLTKHDFEKLEAKYFQKFETVISCLLSYVEFKCLRQGIYYLASQKWMVLVYQDKKFYGIFSQQLGSK